MTKPLGIVKIAYSAKATMSVLVLACATAAVLLGKIDGTSYATIITVVSTIFHISHTVTDMHAISASYKLQTATKPPEAPK